MAFPSVRNIAYTQGSDLDGAGNLTLPTRVAGDKLVAIIAVGGNSTAIAPSAGWTERVDIAIPTGLGGRFWVGERVATNNASDNLDPSGNNSNFACAIFAVQDGGTLYVATPATGTGETPNPPNLAPGVGAKDFLWIAAFGSDNNGANNVNTWPTSFTLNQGGVAEPFGQASVVHAARQQNVSSQDPSAFDYSTGGFEDWAATTIGVEPASIAHTKTLADQIRVTDALSLRPRKALSDQVRVQDEVALEHLSPGQMTDKLSITDTLTLEWHANRSLSDQISLEDELTLLLTSPPEGETTILTQAQARASSRFQEAVRRSHRLAVLIQVLSQGQVIAELDTVLDGSVSLQGQTQVRGTFDISLAHDATKDITMPTGPEHPLAPYGNEVRICRGVRYFDGTAEVVSLGVFRIETVSVDNSTPGTIGIRLSGRDRAARVIDALFEEPFQIASGTLFTDGILSAVRTGYPDVQHQFAVTSVTTPLLVAEEADDPWDMGQGMSEALGGELYFDGTGLLRLVPISIVGPPVVDIAEGEGGVLLGIAREWSREGSFNRAIVTGNQIDDTNPIPRGVATDENPLSPTYYWGAYGKVPNFWSSEFITVDEQAADAAAGRLAKNLGSTESINFDTIVNPALEPGNMIRVVREAIEVNQDHVIDQITIPLTAAGSSSGRTRVTQVTS